MSWLIARGRAALSTLWRGSFSALFSTLDLPNSDSKNFSPMFLRLKPSGGQEGVWLALSGVTSLSTSQTLLLRVVLHGWLPHLLSMRG
jgi:hypothetical protein